MDGSDLDNLYGRGRGPSIARLATREPADDATMIIPGYPAGEWRVTAGPTRDRGRTVLTPLYGGFSGAGAFVDDELSGLVTGHTLGIGTIIGPAPLLAEAIEIAIRRHNQRDS